MEQDKNIQPSQETNVNQEEYDNKNSQTKEAGSPDGNTKDGDLKPINNIAESIHIMPADEQQFEKED